MTFQTHIRLTINHSKEIPDLTDHVSGRAYTIDGVTDTTATILESSEPEPPQRRPFDTFNLDRAIEHFNKMYGLEAPERPTLRAETPEKMISLLRKFHDILQEEMAEVGDLVDKLESGKAAPIDILTDLADWLGDIMVYCASEMRKYGLRSNDILGIIMSSNFSKLGPDGKAIYDARGKVLKGPNYWKPEPMIRRLLEAQIRLALPPVVRRGDPIED
jgi:predicted HAD superfamily Cof-like phosphohydrolase